MFDITNVDELRSFLEFIRSNRICSYVGKICDCKFGIEEEAYNKFGGEKTGCPELRTILGYLENMTQEDWDKYTGRRSPTKRYKTINISKKVGNLDFPDNLDYPHICQYVEDEEDIFIVDKETGEFWKASDFFYMKDMSEFIVERTKRNE